jgi:hypothetical protein
MRSVDTVIADVHGKELDLLVERLSGNAEFNDLEPFSVHQGSIVTLAKKKL